MNFKTTLSTFLSLNATAAIAQPTLTASTSIPTAGLFEVYNQNRTYLAGPEGANQTWDFSTQTFFIQKDYLFEACNSSNNCAMFPGTTVVGHQIADSSYTYYKGSTNALSITGIEVTNQNGVPYPYDDFQDYLHFPFTYGDTFIDWWHMGYSSSSGFTDDYGGIDSVEADAWGTLITPAGTFANTLRVKHISTYKDSINFGGGGGSSVINYKSILYTWHDVTHKDFLYSTRIIISNDRGIIDTTNYSTYVTEQPTGILNTSANTLNLKISPNPARDNIQVALNLKERSKVNVSILDVTGRTIYNSTHNNLPAGDNQLNISTSGFRTGIYLVKVAAGNSQTTNKLVIQ